MGDYFTSRLATDEGAKDYADGVTAAWFGYAMLYCIWRLI